MSAPIIHAIGAPLWPRQYAQKILELPKHRREAALKRVPADLQPWVAHLLDDFEMKQQFKLKTLEKQP